MKYMSLPHEWENYLYRPISILNLQTVLHRMTIVDTCKTDHGLAIRVKYQADSFIHEKIVIISGSGDNISAEIADMKTDRLPGRLKTLYNGSCGRLPMPPNSSFCSCTPCET